MNNRFVRPMDLTRPGGHHGEDERGLLATCPELAEVNDLILRGQLDPSLKDWALTVTRAQVRLKLKPSKFKDGVLSVAKPK